MSMGDFDRFSLVVVVYVIYFSFLKYLIYKTDDLTTFFSLINLGYILKELEANKSWNGSLKRENGWKIEKRKSQMHLEQRPAVTGWHEETTRIQGRVQLRLIWVDFDVDLVLW